MWTALLLGASAGTFWKGADVSFVPQVERAGGVYRRAGKQVDPLVEMKKNGLNIARVRIWNDPADGDCGVPQMLALGKRAKKAGLQLMLDFHYSDTWADPGHQTKPAAWEKLGFGDLKQAVRRFTRDTVRTFVREGASPEIVQVGNEVRAGMLWPDGKWDRMDGLAELLKSGLAGVREGEGDAPIRTMVHTDSGGNFEQCKFLFDSLQSRGVEFDLVGVSYYSHWHGTMADLTDNLNRLSERYKKPVVVAETAYPWTFAPSPHPGGRVWGSGGKTLPGYPVSPAGQAAFLRDLCATVRNVPGGRGAGVVYWAPDWLGTAKLPSAGDNLNWFDYAGEALPAQAALGAG